MRLTILGSGTATPSGRRASSGYWLDAGDARLRLDCGAGTVHAMARWGLPWEALTHQWVSHFHVDHAGELPALLFALKHGRRAPRTAPLALVGPAGLRALLDGLATAFGARLLEQEFPVELRELAPGEALALGGGATLRAARTPHTAESLAVRVEAGGRAVAYTGDTAAPGPELAAFFAGADVLLAECAFLDDPGGTPHLAADALAALAAAARVGHLVATHCTFDPEAAGLAARLARGFSGRITVARDGDAVEC